IVLVASYRAKASHLAVLWVFSRKKPLRRQLLQQRLRFFQVARVEPLREPPVHRSQQFASLLHLALVTPEPREAHCGAEFPGFGLLPTGDCKRTLEAFLRSCSISLRRQQRDFADCAMEFGLPQPFLGCFDYLDCFADAAPGIVELAKIRIRFR